MKPNEKKTPTKVLVLLVALSFSGGCIRNLPPPKKPDFDLPSLRVKPPPLVEERGRVVLDVVNGPARAEIVASEFEYQGTYVSGDGKETKFLCQTPCITDLSYGSYEIEFTSVAFGPKRMSRAIVEIGADPSVVRHSLGKNEYAGVGGILGITSAIGGGCSLVWGVTSLAVGVDGGETKTIGGLIALGLGALLMYLDRPDKQPGSTIQWTPTGGEYFRMQGL